MFPPHPRSEFARPIPPGIGRSRLSPIVSPSHRYSFAVNSTLSVVTHGRRARVTSTPVNGYCYGRGACLDAHNGVRFTGYRYAIYVIFVYSAHTYAYVHTQGPVQILRPIRTAIAPKTMLIAAIAPNVKRFHPYRRKFIPGHCCTLVF